MLACQCDVLVKEVRMYWCRGAPQDLGGLDDSQDELRAKEVPSESRVKSMHRLPTDGLPREVASGYTAFYRVHKIY